MSIEVQEVTKLYGDQKALDQVSFSLNKGEIVGFLGPNGAGKSTMMKIMTGYIDMNAGEVNVLGQKVEDAPLFIKRKIGYLPEHNPLYLDMYVHEFLRFCARLFKISKPKERISELIERVGLQKEQHKKIGALSKGYRQRVGLAHALLHDPEVLILDEPTTGLDPNQIIEIRNLIKEIGKEKTVILSTHIMQEVEAICDRVIIIDRGRIVTDKPIEELRKSFKKAIKLKVTFDRPIDKKSFKDLPLDLLSEKNLTEFVLANKSDEDIRPSVFELAVKLDVKVLELKQIEDDLESIFHQLTDH
jgi:ABC-2 type transport system ATP-binding protein